VDPTPVPFEGLEDLAALQVPHTKRTVQGARDDTSTGQHRHRVDPIRVPYEGLEGLAALQVPHTKRTVQGARDDTSTGQHRHRVDPMRVSFEGADQGATGLSQALCPWTKPNA